MLKLDINLLFTVINLIIWYLLIRKFLFGPINQIIAKRKESIEESYAQAKKVEEAAREKELQCEALKKEIEAEKEKTLQKAQEDAQTAYQQIIDEANGKAEKLLEDSRRQAELAHEKMVSQAEKEIRTLLFDAAVNKVRGESDGAVYEQFLTKAGETRHAES